MNPTSRLREWLHSNGRSQSWLAANSDTYPQRICDFFAGRRRLSAKSADRIEAITGGFVTMRDLVLADLKPAAKPAKKRTRRMARKASR